MSDIARKFLALTLLFVAAIIGAVSLTAFFHFLYAGSTDWVNLGMNEAERLVFNTLLSFAFFVQHSGMIRRPFRQHLGSFIPPHYQGATYTVASGLILLAVVAFWQGSEVILVEIDGLFAYGMRAFYFLSILGTVWGLWALHSFDMFGLDPIRKKLQAKPSSSMPFAIRGPYRWVRHPLYLFMIVLIWSYPILTTDRMLFNIIWTVWIVVGTVFEERDLVDDFGDAYRDYQAKVPMLIPHGIRPAHAGSKKEAANHDALWIISEICYYLGLVSTVLFIPLLTVALWTLSFADIVNPNYWYLLIAWVLSALMFLAGVGLKNFIYSSKTVTKTDETNT